jgi:DNA polymerase elongation subunit (family B)
MELELEKVYQPSLMISKKRYVGYQPPAHTHTHTHTAGIKPY